MSFASRIRIFYNRIRAVARGWLTYPSRLRGFNFCTAGGPAKARPSGSGVQKPLNYTNREMWRAAVALRAKTLTALPATSYKQQRAIIHDLNTSGVILSNPTNCVVTGQGFGGVVLLFRGPGVPF